MRWKLLCLDNARRCCACLSRVSPTRHEGGTKHRTPTTREQATQLQTSSTHKNKQTTIRTHAQLNQTKPKWHERTPNAALARQHQQLVRDTAHAFINCRHIRILFFFHFIGLKRFFFFFWDWDVLLLINKIDRGALTGPRASPDAHTCWFGHPAQADCFPAASLSGPGQCSGGGETNSGAWLIFFQRKLVLPGRSTEESSIARNSWVAPARAQHFNFDFVLFIGNILRTTIFIILMLMYNSVNKTFFFHIVSTTTLRRFPSTFGE